MCLGDHDRERDGAAAGPRTNEQRLGPLLALIGLVPVPSERPTQARISEVRGLNLLDLALRMDQVSRMTETLQLIDQGHMRRSITLDLDLDLRTLTSRHWPALAVGPFAGARPWLPREEADDFVPTDGHS